MNPRNPRSASIRFPILISTALLITAIGSYGETYTTLIASTWNLGTNSVVLEVKSNEVAKVVSATVYGQGRTSLELIKGPVRAEVSSSQGIFNTTTLPTVTGPAQFRLTTYGVTQTGLPPTTNSAIVTLQTFPRSNDDGFLPSSSVVIPSDSSGPVTVVLESSVDLITWTPALPGTYSASTEKRFFRVRAER